MPVLRNVSPEVFFLFSALLGAGIAAAVSRFTSLGFGFWKFWAILLSIDVITYIAMKAGWMKKPGQNGKRS